MKRFLGVRALVAAPLLALACFTLSASGAGATAITGTRVMAPKPLLPHGAKQIGAVASSAPVSGAVVLQSRDEAGLTHFISQVTDKHSPLFHHYLAPGAFAARFGPTSESIDAVKSQLRADGLSITGVDRDGLIVHFKAPATRVESTFRTGLERYKLADGSIGQARTQALQVPKTIAKYVTSVVGLDTTVKLHSSSIIRAPRSKIGTYPAATAPKFIHPVGSPTACSDATEAATAFGGLTDDQVANAYGAFGLYGAGDRGEGQNIAIFELEPFAIDDIQTFDACYFGDAAAADMVNNQLHVIPVDGGQPVGPGEGEATLDVQDVSAFAPGANIDVYEAPNNTAGSIDQYAQIINDDNDNVVTTSWGICEQGIQEGSPGVQQAENLLFQQAAAQGQSVFSAAGDNGSDDCNEFRTTSPVSPVLSVDDPSSQPYVIAAGGTTIDNATQPALEHVWNDGAAWGSAGGGISESWGAPTWQLDTQVPGGISTTGNQDTVAAADSFEAADMGNPSFSFCQSDNPGGVIEPACRQLPDVSADSDEFTGAITIFVGELGFGWTTIGGTSSAAPMWAAMLADVNASPECVNNGITNVGFASPLLYSVASNPTAYAASFNDITDGNNDQYGFSDQYPATTGYDMASGLGSPQLTQPGGGAGLAAYLCDAAPASITHPTVTNVSPAVGFTSDPDSPVTITGTGFEASGTPDVADIMAGGTVIPRGLWNVTSPTTIDVDLPPANLLTSPGDQTDGAGNYQVIVTLDAAHGSGSSAPNPNSVFTYVDENGSSQSIPTVTSVHTFAGPDAGGNTVKIFGTGFGGATGVTFGGVPATSAIVMSDSEIDAKVPAFDSLNTSCDQDGSTFGENALNDICQAQVVVTNANGSSNTANILPLYEGAFAINDHAVLPAPAGQEAAPASTEYDYLPTPTITSISTDIGDPNSLASEEGGSIVTIEGTGFNLVGLESVNFGDPTSEFSQNFFSLVEVTGTEIQIAAPPEDITTDPSNIPVSVSTLALADPFNPPSSMDAIYAGIPTVSSVFATSGPTVGTNAGPDTGGTPIEIDGEGFADQVLAVTFNDIASPFSFGTQYHFSAGSDNDLETTTVSQNPAVVDTQVCTATDCSFPGSFADPPDFSDAFLLFPPGAPSIDSVSPSSGPETGGTEVTITGQNLGCVTSISFGNTQAETFTNQEALLDCGSTNTVTVTAPAHAVGTVPITLTTVESDATGDAPASGSFTYTTAPVLTVAKTGAGSGTVTSAPGGIDCGTTCSHKFGPGTSVTLTATPGTNSVFAGWSGGGCSGTGTCTVGLNSDTTVTATFALAPETLTVITSGTGSGEVTSSPGGIDCTGISSSCTHQFAFGTSVTLTAVGFLHGGTFVGWSGACTGTGTCTVTMNSATTVVATFNPVGGPPPPPQCVVPSVKGKTLSAARRSLSSHHCKPGKISHAFSSKVKKGRVISQKPRAHARLKNGAKVALTLSKGKKPKKH